MKKDALVISLIGLGLGTLGYFYTRRPKGTVTINPDGSGTIKLGNKSADFEKGMGVVVKTWNGWELSGSATGILLRHYGKIYEQGGITQFYGGSTNVQVIFKK